MTLGALLLGGARQVLRLTRTPPSGPALTLTRVLGARYTAQGILDLAVPHDRRLDAAVEVLHAASMLALARPGRAHARLALISAGVAAALAVGDLAARP